MNDPITTGTAKSASPSAAAAVSGALAPNTSAGPMRAQGELNPAAQEQSLGVGTEGEVSIWKGRYSLKNFILRTIVRVLVTAAWVGLLAYLGDRYHRPGRMDWEIFVWITGTAIGLYWLLLLWQIVRARFGHLYELTNRRLFINTGFFQRRRDQIELLRVQDVYVKQQGLLHRMLGVGTVVIESSEERLPIHYLTGVSNPVPLMDLIWHHARKERDMRSVKVDEV